MQDFLFSQTVRLDEDGENGWKSYDKDNDIVKSEYVKFNISDVKGAEHDGRLLPPYYIELLNPHTNCNETWYLEQYGMEFSETIGMNTPFHGVAVKSYKGIPKPGNFKWAHKVMSKPTKYLDYFYV